MGSTDDYTGEEDGFTVKKELDLLHAELRGLQKRNVKKMMAMHIPPALAIDLKIDTLLGQVFPDAIERARFNLFYEGQLRTKLQEWEIALRASNAAHPVNQQLFRPNGGVVGYE